jgi:hypothetical protein
MRTNGTALLLHVTFTLVNLTSIVFVAKKVPETKGRSLEELEDQFRTGVVEKTAGTHATSSH